MYFTLLMCYKEKLQPRRISESIGECLLVLYLEIIFHTLDSRKLLVFLSFGILFTSATWH